MSSSNVSHPSIRPLRISSQWRLIAPNTEIKILLIELQDSYLILQKFEYFCMTAQGNQDLVVSLMAGGEIFRSGSFSISDNGKTKTYAETAISEATGLPYSRVSSATGGGVMHNVAPQDIELPAKFAPNTLVYAKVKNQSAYFSHAICIDVSGLFAQGGG